MHGNQRNNSPSDGALAKVHVTFFKNYAATSLTTDNLTLLELRERVLNTSRRHKSRSVTPRVVSAKCGDGRYQLEGLLKAHRESIRFGCGRSLSSAVLIQKQRS